MKTQIKITTDAKLSAYTHAVGEHAAEELARFIGLIEEQGMRVLSARSWRTSVPSSYRSAYKMCAPYYAYDGETIAMVDGTLENRPKGASIPAVLVVEGETVPEGFRCFRRLEGRVEVRRA
jgi:hypothetical protein